MKRALLAAAAVIVVIGSGCQHHNLCRNSCGCRGGSGGGRASMNASMSDQGTQGPASAAVAYPYYTNRGPRDFFQNNPPTIGR